MNLTEKEKQIARDLLNSNVSKENVIKFIEQDRQDRQNLNNHLKDVNNSNTRLEDIGIGAIKSGGKTLKHLSDFGEVALNAYDDYVVNPISKYTRSAYQGIPSEQAQKEIEQRTAQSRTRQEQFSSKIDKTLEYTNSDQESGGFVGEMAQWLIPQTKINKVADGMGLLGRAGVQALGGAGTGAIIDDDPYSGALYGGVGGAAGEFIAPTLGLVSKGAKKVKRTPLRDIFKKSEKTVAESAAKEDSALEATAELLQQGNKKEEMGRLGKYSNTEVEAMKIIRDSDDPYKNFQDLVEKFSKEKNKFIEKRKEILEPYTKTPIKNIDEILGGSKNKIDYYLKNGDIKVAEKFEEMVNNEMELGLKTVGDISERKQYIDKKISDLFDSGGRGVELSPTEKIEKQVWKELAADYRKELNKIAGKEYEELGKKTSATSNAYNALTIQRGRAKKALKDIDWEVMTLKERAMAIADKLPYLRGNIDTLVKIDTKSGLLDSIVEQKVRQIRIKGKKAKQINSKGTQPIGKDLKGGLEKPQKNTDQQLSQGKNNISYDNYTTKEVLSKAQEVKKTLGKDHKITKEITKLEKDLEKQKSFLKIVTDNKSIQNIKQNIEKIIEKIKTYLGEAHKK